MWRVLSLFIKDLVLSIVQIYICSSWAESNDVVRSTFACKCTLFVIISIAVSVGACATEYLRVICRWACLWSVLRRSATVLWLLECDTCAHAGNHFPIGPFLCSSLGQTLFTFFGQLAVLQSPVPPCGFTDMGTLKPSTRLTS